ncbi:MAG: hypothetical protein ACREA3_06655 [Nitrosotalea sp.]
MRKMKNGFIAALMSATIVAVFFMPMSFAQYYEVHHTTLVLDPIPRTLEQGHHLTFSGKLLTSDDKTPLPERTIFIEYDSPYDCTRILTSATTDNNGNFSVSWIAVPKGISGGTYNLFAKFNGDDDNFYSISKQFPLNVIPRSVQNGVGTIGEENVIFSFGPCG